MKKSKYLDTLEDLEDDLMRELKSYVSKKSMIENVIPHDMDSLVAIAKANPKQFDHVITNMRQVITMHLERKIGLR